MSDVSSNDLAHCTRVLEAIARDSLLLSQLTNEERLRLFMAAGQVIRPEKTEVRRRLKAMRRERWEAKRARDRTVRAVTSIRAARVDAVFVPPPRLIEGPSASPQAARELQQPRDCYICKTEFSQLHHFYDALCPRCAALNYEKRFQSARLDGQVALITGARLKIGYQAALMMLRAGARVVVTTRFPKDAAHRYAREKDFGEWSQRLEIHGLDLRHSPSVEAFTRYLERHLDRLDILINNAAQTVRRPPGFYAHLLETEKASPDSLPAEVQALLSSHERCKAELTADPGASAHDGTTWVAGWHAGKLTAPLGVVASAELSQIPYACDQSASADADRAALFPEGHLDADLQQVDLRKMNSWRMTLADVPTAELLEVQLVNSIAPFILCSKLKGLMLRHPTGQKHIVNVSAMEGKFNRHTKTDKHPHTNMAKAALNMLTLTSARDYARSGIFMNAVDTGWVTDEDPAEIAERKQREQDFQPPLDIVDGAARVLDPVFSGLQTGKHSWGNFLKDYFPTEW